MRKFNVNLTAEEFVWITWKAENEKRQSQQNWGEVGFYNNLLHKIKPENVGWQPESEGDETTAHGGSGVSEHYINEFIDAVLADVLGKFIAQRE